MRKKFSIGQVIFTCKNITDLYVLTSSGSKTFKLKPGTALIVVETADQLYSKIADKYVAVELDLEIWVPVFYLGNLGWIYYDDVIDAAS